MSHEMLGGAGRMGRNENEILALVFYGRSFLLLLENAQGFSQFETAMSLIRYEMLEISSFDPAV